jgi:predicted Zn-dependent peptidase
MKAAHKANYDRSRCAFVAVGSLDAEELLSELEKDSGDIPDNGLSARYMPESYGPLPLWKKGDITIKEVDLPSSTVLMLFPIKESSDLLDRYFRWNILGDMFNFGGMDSPLMRVLRDERKLVYSAYVAARYLPQGGYWGFAAEAQNKNVDAIIEAFRDVLRDKQVYSSSRVEEVKTGLSGAFDIRAIDTSEYRQQAVNRLVSAGRAFSDDDYLDALNKTTSDDVKQLIDSIDPSDAHTIIFKGVEK